MSDNTDYKNTLNLPQSSFPMKAELPKKEPLLLKAWQENGLHSLLRRSSQERQKYILHDGPPYANGDIHIGHALNKTLKDIIVKYKTMRGFDSAYVPGWDCHGLPIEHALFKELKIHKSQISQVEFRKKAYKYAMGFVDRQREQFKRLGIFGDWENPYLTLTPDYEASILESFLKLLEEGYIYDDLKPVNWCFKCETALAEAEVEYEDHVSPSVFVKFKLEENKLFPGEAFLLVWTTTPWTLIANVAVAVHPELTYSYVKTGKGNLIIASVLLPAVMAQAGIDKYEVMKEMKGCLLEGLIYAHPLILRKARVVLADYVSKDEGTGLVHTAPGHGNEDYLTGLKYKLEIIMPVDNRGNFDKSAGEFSGMNVYDANKPILEKLASIGALLFDFRIQHSYPHCWRCKTPIIFRATKQWFLNLDHQDLRRKLIAAIEKDVTWVPASGEARIKAMVELRPHWCLSRQRYWGVPIPSLVCKKCGKEFFSREVVRSFTEYVKKEGTDCWFTRQIQDFISGDSVECPVCKAKEFSKGVDILDVWFDSGVSHQAVLKKRKELKFPADLYLEGSDQHRGWFQSSLIPSVCIEGKAPFKTVLTHGFVVDGVGRKMSKSMGNVISPQDIIKDYGADILRLWVSSSDYNEDIRISKEILTRLSEAYRKIRNTAKFILSNLYDFHPDKNKVGEESFRKIDRWILARLIKMVEDAGDSYEKFQFHKAYKVIYDFCNEDLSMYYLDMVKGRLYTYAADSAQRRAAQSVLYEVLNALVRITAPLLVFTADEIWQNMPRRDFEKSISSVHLLSWPSLGKLLSPEVASAESQLKEIIALIPEAAKLLEEMRSKGLIGSSFDAKIKLLTNNEERYKFLSSLKSDLCEVFKVSQVEICREGQADIAVTASKAEGVKCVRCWNYSSGVGSAKEHPLICVNCFKAIGGKS